MSKHHWTEIRRLDQQHEERRAEEQQQLSSNIAERLPRARSAP